MKRVGVVGIKFRCWEVDKPDRKCRLCKIAFSKLRLNGLEEPFREHFLLDSLEPHILYV